MATALPQAERLTAPFNWFGGKSMLAKWIIGYLPDCKTYVEPYAGSAAVLWARRPTAVEVLNDIDGEIVNVYHVLQDPTTFQLLHHKLEFTPYSRAEFGRAIEIGKSADTDSVTRAWAFIVRHRQGFSGEGKTIGQWSRDKVGRRSATSWARSNAALSGFHARLRNVQIESQNALDCVGYWDSPGTTFYLDPPYVMATRASHGYRHEVDDDHHAALVARLLAIEGAAVLSGYDTPIYARLLEAGWHKVARPVVAHSMGRKKAANSGAEHTARTECLWVSPNKQRSLF